MSTFDNPSINIARAEVLYCVQQHIYKGLVVRATRPEDPHDVARTYPVYLVAPEVDCPASPVRDVATMKADYVQRRYSEDRSRWALFPVLCTSHEGVLSWSLYNAPPDPATVEMGIYIDRNWPHWPQLATQGERNAHLRSVAAAVLLEWTQYINGNVYHVVVLNHEARVVHEEHHVYGLTQAMQMLDDAMAELNDQLCIGGVCAAPTEGEVS